MPKQTPRQRIKKADEFINKELYKLENGDIKGDTINRTKKLYDQVRNANYGTTNTERPFDVINTMAVQAMQNRGKAQKEFLEKNKVDLKDNMAAIFNGAAFEGDNDRFTRYGDYRTIDKYISEVAVSLDVLRDSILSPDDISKKSVIYHYDGELDSAARNLFEENMRVIFDKYNLESYISEEIRDTLKLGDGFSIVSPMSVEFNKMLSEGQDFILDEGLVLSEDDVTVFGDKYDAIIAESYNQRNLQVTNGTEKTPNPVDTKEYADKLASYINQTKKEVIKMINDHVKFNKDPLKVLSDQAKFADAMGSLKPNQRKKLDINGAYFRDIDPDDMIKLEVDHVCIGYIYINRSASNLSGAAGNGTINSLGVAPGSMIQALTAMAGNNAQTTLGNGMNVMTADMDRSSTKNGNTALEYRALVDMIITGISKKVDNKFIEKNEQFRDLILAMVKTDYLQNNDIYITFMEPDEVEHVKIDSTATYGVSRLDSTLFYAKLYLSSLITNLMVKVNQGRERRVFYVDADMDDDMESSIQQIIRDFRSNEIPADMFSNNQSISTTLKLVGAADNLYVPTIDGNRPFDIDVLSGIQTDIEDDLMDKLKRSVISGIGVPYNYIDATNDIDFARSLSMQNQGFVKKIIYYQQIFGRYFTKVIRKIYEYEFGKTEHDKARDSKLAAQQKNKAGKKTTSTELDRDLLIDPENIEIVFPEPVFLNVTTSNEQIDATNNTIEYVSGLYLQEEATEDEKNHFKRVLAREVFLKHLDWDRYDDAFRTFKKEMNENKIKEELTKANSGDDTEGSDDTSSSSDSGSSSDDFGGGSYDF